MNGLSSRRVGHFSESYSFCPPYANQYQNDRRVVIEEKFRRTIYNTDLDCYSDLSEDTPSILSFDSSDWTKHNNRGSRHCFVHPEIKTFEEALQQYGNICDQETLTPLELTSAPNSPTFSDAEMCDRFLSEEQQRLQYLAELVHVEADTAAADYFAEFYSGVPPEAYWDSESLLQNHVNFSNKNTSILGELSEEDCFNMEPFHEHEKSINSFQKVGSWMRVRSQLQASKTRQRKLKEIYDNEGTSELFKRFQHTTRGPKKKGWSADAPIEISEVKGVPLNAFPNGRKQNNDKVKAKAASLLCDSKLNSQDDQKVFLGGLPIGITERTLREEMSALGFKVLKRPKILRGFAPEVWLRSVEQAQELVSRGTITLGGVRVEVRPYNSMTKLSELKKIPNVGKRSIFLGGLPRGATTEDIKEAIKKMGMEVLNYPVIKDGFSRQVILEKVAQAKTLIGMKKIFLKGKMVDVRPFVNQFRKSPIH